MAKSNRKNKKSNRKEPWRDVYVMARIDECGNYEPGNVHWRLARTPYEARMGIEGWFPGEPEAVPLTEDQKRQRALLTSKEQLRSFDIWARMIWRCSQEVDNG